MDETRICVLGVVEWECALTASVMKIELGTHQKEALKKLTSGKILWGGVGSGKSMVAAALYVRDYTNRDVYVITTAKKRDSRLESRHAG